MVDQMGMGLYLRQFWGGIVCVPMGVASRPYPGTHSLQGVRVEAVPVAAYMQAPGLGPGGWEGRVGEG